MEDTLGAQVLKHLKKQRSLNPCFNGILSDNLTEAKEGAGIGS